MDTHKIRIFCWLLCLTAFSACQLLEEGNVDLDNAGTETLKVTIDELTYTMAPASHALITLEKGFHKISIKDENGKELEQSNFEVKTGGLINLAKSTYYVWYDLYGDQSLRDSKLHQDWLEIENEDGKIITIFGEYHKMPEDELYLEAQWDYGLTEDFPGRLWGMEITDEKFKIRRKLFRPNELLAAYYERAPQPEISE